jgi:hypothetical protein
MCGPKKKRGYMVCTGDYIATNTQKPEGLQEFQRTTGCDPKGAPCGFFSQPARKYKKKRGYMVCTGDCIATNTRKARKSCKKFSGNRLSDG